MKKLFLLFSLFFIVTGCSTEVTLKIDSEKVSEKIKIYELKDKAYSNGELNDDIKSNIKAFEREYEFYDMNEFEELDYIVKTYELSEDIELWGELSHLRPCYEKFKLSKTNTNISLETSEEYRCGYLFGANDVLLTIESDLELVSSNADRVNGNKLIWNINSSNYKNKSIKFDYKIISSSKDSSSLEYILYLIIICLGIGVFFFIRKKNNESNKI